ncbi:MAG: 30S ribosomal protein S15 [Lentisphaeria bacterium]|jgi:small subunit ribosomal protein S15
MDQAQKQAIIKEFARSQNDVGSSDVQVAVLTNRINELSGHLEKHPKDNGTRRGLLTMVSRRRRLLGYLKRTDLSRYQDLVKRLSLRH